MQAIEIIIQNDYEGYFQRWAERLKEELEARSSNIIQTIYVDSGPYRNCGLSYEVRESKLYLDFYSAVRMVFGSIGISQKEFADLLTK